MELYVKIHGESADDEREGKKEWEWIEGVNVRMRKCMLWDQRQDACKFLLLSRKRARCFTENYFAQYSSVFLMLLFQSGIVD